MMIWLAAKNSHGSVDLLDKEHPYHLMIECHARQ